MTKRLGGIVLAVAGAALAASLVAIASLGSSRAVQRPMGTAVAPTMPATDAIGPAQEIPPPTLARAFFDRATPVNRDLTAAAKSRETLERAVSASGEDEGPWTERAREVFVGMKKSIPARLARQIMFRKIGYFRNGCMLDVVYPNLKTFEDSNAAFLASAGFQGWPGGKGRSAMEVTKAGAIRVLWLLMNPRAQSEERRRR